MNSDTTHCLTPVTVGNTYQLCKHCARNTAIPEGMAYTHEFTPTPNTFNTSVYECAGLIPITKEEPIMENNTDLSAITSVAAKALNALSTAKDELLTSIDPYIKEIEAKLITKDSEASIIFDPAIHSVKSLIPVRVDQVADIKADYEIYIAKPFKDRMTQKEFCTNSAALHNITSGQVLDIIRNTYDIRRYQSTPVKSKDH